MRKTILDASQQSAGVQVSSAVDVESLARVEVTSEDKSFPIEHVFLEESDGGWRASAPGPQTIRLLFDRPVDITRIVLLFEEQQVTRTQEFLLRWQGTGGQWQDVVRQQWNFSPSGSTEQREDVRAALAGAKALELQIRPDLGNSSAKASLKQWLVY